jgi:hypothetical protein
MTTGAQFVQSTLRAALPRAAKPHLEPVYRTHPARGAFENFIAARFGRA